MEVDLILEKAERKQRAVRKTYQDALAKKDKALAEAKQSREAAEADLDRAGKDQAVGEEEERALAAARKEHAEQLEALRASLQTNAAGEVAEAEAKQLQAQLQTQMV